MLPENMAASFSRNMNSESTYCLNERPIIIQMTLKSHPDITRLQIERFYLKIYVRKDGKGEREKDGEKGEKRCIKSF